MKQFFEAFFGVVIIVIITTLAIQGVMTNQQISAAREYHNTVIEQIENMGMSEKYAKQLEDKTNKNTDYTLSIDKVQGSDDTKSYHVSLTYRIKALTYMMFGNVGTKTAVIDGYASVGKTLSNVSAEAEEKHGSSINSFDLGTDCKATLYKDGYLIFTGDSELNGNLSNSEYKDLKKVSEQVEAIVFTGDTKTIPKNYFKDFINIEKLYLGKIETIDENAFESCENLISFTINGNMKNIKKNAFKSCDYLSEIYVNNQAENITIDPEATSDCMSNPKWIYLK